MTLRESIEKLAVNYLKLMLVEAGLPMLLDKIDEVKVATELKIKRAINKTILLSIAMFFLLITFVFLFVGIFFYFSNTGLHSNAAFYTSGIALLVSIIIFIIAAF